MLAPCDANLVTRDPDLPGLALLLDPAALSIRLREALPGLDVRAVEPSYLRYKPRTSCIAGYRLKVGDGALYGYARAHPPRDRAKLLKFVEGAATAAERALTAPPVYLHEYNLAACLFPHDDAMPSLATVADSAELTRLARKIAPGLACEAALEVVPLAYKPERRFVGQLRCAGAPVAVVRFYADDSFDTAVRNAKRLQPDGPLRVPRRLGRDEDRRVFALEWLPGSSLDRTMAQDRRTDVLRRVHLAGQALASLAAQPWRWKLRRNTAAEQAGALLEVSRALGQLWPPLACRAATLAERVAAGVAEHALAGSDLRPTHGDFNVRQVLCTEDGGVALLDFDELARGDPAADIANFAADLHRAHIAGAAPCVSAEEAAEVLRDSYRTAQGATSDGGHFDARVRTHTAAQLLRMSPHLFRSRIPDWPQRTTLLLDRIEKLLGGGTPRSRPAHSKVAAGVSDPFDVVADPALPMARSALELDSMRDRLTPVLRGAGLADNCIVTTARVVRHKPRRRCVIEYQVSCEAGSDALELTVVAKIRAKGTDERTHATAAALWAQGFDASSADDISVPQPLGVLPDLHMTLQRKVPGEPVTKLLAKTAGHCWAARLADVAHKLHRTAVPSARRHEVNDELTILDQRLTSVGLTQPELAEEVHELLTGCRALAARLDDTRAERPTAGIHRDYYPDQVLIDRAGGRAYLLDLDLYCQGDPTLDIGNCMAHITEQGLRSTGEPDAFDQHERALLERYAELAGADARPAVLAYAALTLARHVYISTLFDERRPFTRRLLTLSAVRVRRACEGLTLLTSRRRQNPAPVV